jgi:thiol-disulfide isomerase/thioredoxin
MWSRWSLFILLFLAFVGCGQKGAPSGGTSAPAGPATAGQQAAPAKPQLASGILQQAEAAAQSGDLDKAITLAEQAVSASPQDTHALFVLASLAQSRGFDLATGDRKAASSFFLKCVSTMRKLRDAKPDLSDEEKLLLSNALYNEACVFALENQADKALASLREAFAAGFDNVSLLATDVDLQALRQLPEFQSLLGQAREALQKRCREESREELARHLPFSLDFSLPDLTGKTVSLGDYKGKVVIVDLWGTWCPPCRMEIPHFLELVTKYRGAGLEVVGINYEQLPAAEWKPTIAKVAKEIGITYPCLIGDEATQSKIPNLEGFPTTLFVDRAGVVRLKLVGYHPYEKLESVVLLLLEEKPVSAR